MDNKKIIAMVNDLDCLGSDLEKIRIIASEGFELLTPVNDYTDQEKAFDMLQKQPTLTTFFSIIMDYADKVSQVLEQSTSTIFEEVKEREVNNGK